MNPMFKQIDVRYCATCGRTDLHSMLSKKHWTNGELCRESEIRWARYALVQTSGKPFTKDEPE